MEKYNSAAAFLVSNLSVSKDSGIVAGDNIIATELCHKPTIYFSDSHSVNEANYSYY